MEHTSSGYRQSGVAYARRDLEAESAHFPGSKLDCDYGREMSRCRDVSVAVFNRDPRTSPASGRRVLISQPWNAKVRVAETDHRSGLRVAESQKVLDLEVF